MSKKTKSEDVPPNEEEAFKKKYSGVLKTVDYILSGKEQKLIDGILEDYAPSDNKRAPGISGGSVLKGLGFAVRNIGKMGSVIKLGREYNDIIYNNTFQQELLKNDNTWKFVQTVGERLPKVGTVLANMNFPEFKEGAILDKKALEKLQPILTDKNSVESIRKIATQFKDPNFDQNENINQIFDLMIKSPAFKDYMQDKGGAIKDYIVATAKSYIDTDNLKPLPRNKDEQLSYQEQLSTYGLKVEDLDKIANIVPILLNEPEALKKFYNNYSKGDYIGLTKDLLELSKNNKAVGEYLQNNNELFKGIANSVIKSTPALEKLELKGELLDMFGPLLTSKNAEQVKGMVEKYEKADWPGIAIDFCKMIENDPEFKQHLDNNRGNLGKITQAILDGIPSVKQYKGDMKIDALVENVLNDPKGLREAAESFQKGGKEMVWGVGKFAVKKLLDSKNRGALLNSDEGVKQLLLSNMEEKGPAVMLEFNREMMGRSRQNLNDFAKEIINISYNDSPGLKEKFIDMASKNQLFSNVTIQPLDKEVFKLENMVISESFVSSSFENVSFKGSKFTGSSFVNASFKNVDFSGAEIDGATLQSLELQLQKGEVSLKGAKIVGDMPPGMNLSGADLSGVDLSGVTSMNGVNLKNTDLSNAKLPKENKVFESAYNLSNAKMPEGYVPLEMISTNPDKALNLMLDAMVNKAKLSSAPILDEKAFREKITEIYKSNTPIGAKMREDLTNDPHIISQGGFPITGQTHYSDLSKAGSAITVLYNSKNDITSIESKLSTNLIADKISENLFQKGDNRGADAVLIRSLMQDSITEFVKDNPTFKASNVVGHPNFDKMLTNITETIRAETKSTTVGKLSGGIYLPKESVSEELTNSIKKQLAGGKLE